MFFEEIEYTTSNKSEEELRKLTLEENLSEVQRTYIILTKGQQLQKRAIYTNLHRILRQPKAFDQLFRVIYEELQQQDEEIQIVASKSLYRLIKEYKLGQQELYQIHILSCEFLKIWSTPVLDAWYITMDQLLKSIDLQSVFPQTQQLILILTDSSQPTISRISASRLIGTMAEIIGAKIKGPLFDRARMLCSDPDRDIRQIMASEVMFKVCMALPQDLLETYMLEKTVELYFDSDLQVKLAGMKLFFDIAPNLSVDEQKGRCVRMFIDQIQSQNEDSKVLMSRLCGKVYSLLYDHINRVPNMHNIFLQIYREWAKSKNPLIRINFAYNFPAILKHSQKKFEVFEDVYLLAAADQNEEVARTIVSSFHEVVHLSENTDPLVITFNDLMHCQSINILEVVVARFVLIVNSFPKHQQTQFSSSCIDLLNHLTSKPNWNVQSQYLTQLLECQQLLTDHDTFINALLTCLSNGTTDIKRLCALNMAKFLSTCPDLRRRQASLSMLADTLFRADSYVSRIAFLDLVEGFCTSISRRLFKQLGLFCVFEYSKDPVVNVRIRLIKLLPIIRLKIDLDDDEILDLFNEATNECGKGNPRSFSHIIQYTKEQLTKNINNQQLIEADLILQQQEDIIFQNDVKVRQLELDHDKVDFEFNKNDFNEYLNRLKKKYNLPRQTKVKITQTLLAKKTDPKQLSGSLFIKKSVDYDGLKGFENRKVVPKAKTPLVKSVTEVRKVASGFKLPSLKK